MKSLRAGTPIWNVDPNLPGGTPPEAVSAVLRSGGVIVYPTETFYGIGADPRDESAVRRVYLVKGRSADKPLPLIASDIDSVLLAVTGWTRAAGRLAAHFWPGPLTLLLFAGSVVSPLVNASTAKIAVRVSSHPVARALAAAAGGLLISTSANRAGALPCSRVEELSRELVGAVDAVVDCGSLPGGAPSTIVDVSGSLPSLVREGCLPWADIKELL